MKHNQKTHHLRWRLLVPVLASIMLCTSCREDYYFDEQEPTWLGESIYDFLVEEGKYTYYVKLIDELGQTPVLSRTGSKTLFVVDDSTFNEFFRTNEWGVESYDSLSRQQKELIFYSSMLNNVFFTNMLGDESNEETGRGMTLRRTSAIAVSNKLERPVKELLPKSYYWDALAQEDYFLAQDNTPVPMVIFSDGYLIANSLKGSDYVRISNSKDSTYARTDVFVNGVRVAEPNLKCKNGVVHRLEKLVTPLTNMAEFVSTDAETQEFSMLLNRFSAPYFADEATVDGVTLPVYVKKYFTSRGHTQGLSRTEYNWVTGGTNVKLMTTPTDSAVGSGLKFDPGWNALPASDVKPMNRDMAAMFVPNDAALKEYWNNGGGGFLRDKYKTWDNVPDFVVVDLLNNHMKSSFAGTVPSKFDQVKNDAQIDMKVKWDDVVETQLCCNGVVYVTNKVYPPVSYVAVTAPTLVNDNMRIIDWATKEYGFLAYLHSMDSYYSFVLPTDEAFARYLDPLSVAKNNPETWEFYYDDVYKRVNVNVYDSLGIKTRELGVLENDMIQNRLEDLIDQHIIVDTIDNAAWGKVYYQTKGNGTVKVTSRGMVDSLNLYGGYQLETQSPIAVSKVSDHSREGNGKTYIVNTLMQSSLKSVYESMAVQATDENAPFYQFFNLMNDAGVFYKDEDYASFGHTVDIFNTYHYTIYVPSNDAVLKAIENGLPTLEQAEAYVDSLNHADAENQFDGEAYIDSIRSIIHDFVCYHIHDNSVYIGGGNVAGRSFQTGTLDFETNTFYRLTVNANNSSLNVTGGDGKVHKVLADSEKEGTLYNIMTRDYLFDNSDLQKATLIETTSFAVVHAIDGEMPLLYSGKQLEEYQEQVKRLQQTLDKSTNE